MAYGSLRYYSFSIQCFWESQHHMCSVNFSDSLSVLSNFKVFSLGATKSLSLRFDLWTPHNGLPWLDLIRRSVLVLLISNQYLISFRRKKLWILSPDQKMMRRTRSWEKKIFSNMEMQLNSSHLVHSACDRSIKPILRPRKINNSHSSLLAF